jgi:hypothetical protein
VDPEGTIDTLVGEEALTFDGAVPADRGRAEEFELWSPRGLAVGPDNTVHLVDGHQGLLRTVAGGTVGTRREAELSGSRVALQTQLVAAAPDGSVYAYAAFHGTVRRLLRDGTAEIALRPGVVRLSDGSGTVELQPWNIDAGPDGALYVSTLEDDVYRVEEDGSVTPVVGGPVPQGDDWTFADQEEDRDPAVEVTRFAVGPDGVYVAEGTEPRVWRFDASGRLLELRDRNGNAVSLTYTGTQLARVADPHGHWITFTYDPGSGRLADTRPTARPASRRRSAASAG